MNLLIDPLLRVATPQGTTALNLPALLEALGQDQVDSLPGLQRHQVDPFHVLLCYLAGAVLARQRQTEPVQPEAFWRDGIRALTGQTDDAAWTLVVEDVTRPAFMQAPLESTAALKQAFKRQIMIPDELDLLPTAKDHDIKLSRIAHSTPEDWVYALISLQTMSGFFGQGNYGIARMNGGFGSRSFVTLLSSNRIGQRFHRDVGVVLQHRSEMLTGPWHYRDDGLVFTWLPAWDRHSSLSLQQLDPFFIEIARAVRLRQTHNKISAWTASTKGARIHAGDAKGNLGDPWIPINHKNSAALTISEAGLTPQLLRDLLFQDGFDAAAMQQPTGIDQGQPCRFHVAVLIRGQGTTGGLRSANIPIPGKVLRLLVKRDNQFDRLAELSKKFLVDASTLQNKILSPALFNLFEGGPETINFDKREIGAWVGNLLHNFSNAWSREYFDWLWRALDETDNDVIRRNWVQALKKQAEQVLENAIASAPGRSGRRLRSITRAERLFRGAFYNQFSDLLKEQQDVNTLS